MTASAGRLREVNLELGKPTVNAAIKRLTFEIHHSRSLGCAALKIIHGYGSHDEKFLDECREFGLDVEKNPQIRLLEYIDNMPQCLSAADLVIGRAGAMTLTEIEAKAKASILIPSPNVAENHQFHNAMALVRRGAAEIIEEKDLTGEALWEKVRAILSDPGRLQSLGENAGKMEVLDASDRIYRVIKSAAAK